MFYAIGFVGALVLWIALLVAYRLGAKDGKAEGYYMAMRAMYPDEMSDEDEEDGE